MVKYSYAKLQELALYITARSEADPQFASVRLAKSLFWSDFGRFRATGEAITGARYIRMDFGPAPNGFSDLLKNLEGGKFIRMENRGKQKRPVALREPDLDLFTRDELAVVDGVIAEQWGKSADQVSDESHKFIGWQIAHPLERIPYGMIWFTNPAPEPTKSERQRALALATRLGRV